ncbi:MAG: S1-like domain-containing RNA-binding protein [Bacteroidota bacterium]
MVHIGKFNTLTVIKRVPFGLYLDGENLGEILLPLRYVPDGTNINSTIQLFIYNDSEDRLIATTQTPFAQVGQFAFLKVQSVNQIGAFLEWGLPKDLLVPFREQKITMQQNKYYMVYLYLDQKTNRIAATSKIEKHFQKQKPDYTEGQQVQIQIWTQTDLGYKAIINNRFHGILYTNEIFQNIQRGQQLTAFIKKIRDDDKIDLTLSNPAELKMQTLTQKILTLLQQNDGFLPVGDKSSTELIYELFNESKRNFKKTIGILYKQRLISIENEGIRLIEDKNS